MSKKIVSYKTVYSRNIETLDDEVNNHLDKGWELYGEQYWDGGSKICQVMVRYEEDGESSK